MTAEIPWLLVAFAGGTIFGGAVVIALLLTLVTELPIKKSHDGSGEWKYE